MEREGASERERERGEEIACEDETRYRALCPMYFLLTLRCPLYSLSPFGDVHKPT